MDFGLLKTNRRLLVYSILLGVFFAAFLLVTTPVLAATGINQQINFQGRLLNSQGATVPDGIYNLEFKIYQDGDGQSTGDSTGSPTGSLKWTEDYLNNNSQGVKVVNGYLSVELGSVNPFGASVNWNQSTLWLSMNIGSTGTTCTPFSACSPDGEMTPMQPLTTAVYSLNSNELGGLTASSYGQLASTQIWTAYNTFKPTSDSTTAFQVQNAAGTSNLLVADTTNTKIGIATAPSSSGATLQVGGSISLTTLGSATNNSLVCQNSSNQLATCSSAVLTGNAFVQSGNSFSAQAVLGTNDSNSLALRTNNTNRLVLDTSGNLTFQQVSTLSTSSGNLTIQANGTSTLALDTTGVGTVTLGATNAGTITVGNTTNNPNVSFNGSGTFGTTTGAVSLNGNTTVTGSKTFTVNGGLASLQAGLTVTGGASSLSGGNISLNVSSNNNTSINTGSSSGTVSIGNGSAGNITLQSGGITDTIASSGNTVQSTTNSATAFQIQNSVAAPILLVDTTSTMANGNTLNYLSYPGFESGSFTNANAGWTAAGSATLSQNTLKQHTYNGLFSAQVVTTGNGDGLTTSSFVSAPAGSATYIVSFYAKVSSGTIASSAFTVTATGGAGSCSPASGITINPSGFQRLFCSLTVGTGSIATFKITQTDSTARTIYIDAIQLQSNSFNGNAITAPTVYQEGTIQLRGVITNPLTLLNNGDSTTAFQIQNAAGVSNLLIADTLNTRIGIGAAPASSLLTIGTNTTSASGGIIFGTDTSADLYRSAAATLTTDGSLVVGTLGSSGTAILCSNAGQISTCGAGAGNGSYIFNSTSLQSTANFNIQSAASGSVGGIIEGAASQSADLLDLRNSTATTLSEITSAGALQGGNASGSNVAGTNLAINGGEGTGTGNGGNINFNIFKASGTSGSTNNTTTSQVLSLSGTNGAATFKNATNSSTAFQVQNSSGNSVLTVDTSGNGGNGQATLGSSSSLQGALTFANAAGSNLITLAAPTTNPASSYTLNLPTATPSAGLCLETSTASASQLVFTACANSNASITYVTNWDAYTLGTATTTINDAPTHVGDLLVLTTKIPNNSSTGITSISGGGVSTWTQVITSPSAGSYNRVGMWMGTVTSTGSATATVTYNSGSGVSNEINVSEYTAAGVGAGTSWGVDTNGTLGNTANVTTITWPTLTSQNADEAYIGYAQSQNGGSSSGCTTNFSCIVTTNNNVLTYNTNTAATTAYSPTATQTSGQYNSVGAIFTAFVSSTAINNSISTQQGNFNVQAATSGTVAGVLEAASSGTADILDLLNGSGTNVVTFSSTGAALFENSTNSTTAFQIQNSGGTSILSANTTNNILQVGSSTANSNGIILALNNYNGASQPTEVDGGMYYDNASAQFLCGEAGYWVSCGSSPADHSYNLYDEFMNGNSGSLATGAYGIGELNWYNSLIGTPGTLTYNYNTTGGNSPAVSADRPGVIDVEQTGVANNSGQTMSLGLGSMLLGTSKVDLKTAVNVTGANLTVIWGLDNETTANTAPTTGVYWKEASNGTWQYCYVNATPAETCANSATTATAGSWTRLEIDIVSSSEIDFYVNGTKTAVTGITYNTTNSVSPAYHTYKSTGTPGTLDLYIDYFDLRGITSAAR